MKKILKTSVLVLLVAVMLAFAGCGGVSKKSADEINEAVNNGTPFTVAEVKDKFGDPIKEELTVGTGFMVYVNGCKTWEDFEAKVDAGEQVGGMVVLCLAGKATVAIWYDNYEGQTK